MLQSKKLLPSCSSYSRMERWMYIILCSGRKLDHEVGCKTVKRMEKRLLLLIAKTLVPLCWPFLAFFTLIHFMLQLLQHPPISFQNDEVMCQCSAVFASQRHIKDV